MRVYKFPKFKLICEQPDVITTFQDGASCKVWTNEEDEKHGKNLGITGYRHKVLHELTHECLALAEGLDYCPIAYNEAHQFPMPEDSKHREEMIMAMAYLTLEKPLLHDSWLERIEDVQKIINPYKLAQDIFRLFSGMPLENVEVE